MYESIWINANLATMAGGGYGVIRKGALAVAAGRIAWVGPIGDLADSPERSAREVHDCRGRWMTPGLIDCHTHVVFAGQRAREFEARLNGAQDQDAAGVRASQRATVQATREASEMELIRSASTRLKRLMDEGVTTVEIKSGYGMDLRNELKMLRVARMLGGAPALTVRASVYAGETLPPEYEGNADAYVDLVCAEILPAVSADRLADALDVFCDASVFSASQAKRLLDAGVSGNLPLSVHADVCTDSGGAALAAAAGALSACGLRYASAEGLQAMAAARTVAVLLPGTFQFSGGGGGPAVAAMRRHGVPMAVATDCNPDTSPATSLLLMLHLACTQLRLTPQEALAGVTANAARALGLSGRLGSLETGKDADFALWDIEEPAQLAYAMGANPCVGVVKLGEVVWGCQ